jgi:hypothetical protein
VRLASLADRRGSSGVVLLLAAFALSASGCGQGDDGSDNVCVVVGNDGGIVKSADSVLTFALRPGALAEDTEICVRPSDEPPDVFGPAYRVRPNLELALPATITYRHELPADPTNVTIGKVDRAEYEAGMGRWIPLERIAIDTADGIVKSTDDELALFYALLDDEAVAGTSSGSEENGSADELGESTTGSTTDAGTTTGTATGPESTSTGDPVTASTTEDSGETGRPEESSSDEGSSEDTGVEYPPECDDIYRGNYPILDVGVLFPEGGSEDLAMSGNSTLVGRNGTGLVEVDGGAATMPYPLAEPFTSTTLGLRYRADGDLLAAQYDTGELLRIQPGGEVDVFFDGLDTPNGIYPDADGYVWVTEYGGYRVRRIDPDGNDDTIIAEGAATAAGANGIIYDDLRQIVFWTKYDDSELWRAPIADDGTPGAAVLVTDLEGFSDGLALDVCGHVYVVDQGADVAIQTRIDRVFLDGDGNHVETEEIVSAGELTASVANAQFGYGDGFELEDALYAVGNPGRVFRIHVQITGHPIAPVAN